MARFLSPGRKRAGELWARAERPGGAPLGAFLLPHA